MRRTTAFTAALAMFGWAAAFAIAQEQQEVPCPPTFTAPSSSTTGPDYYQGSGHAYAPAPVTSPMILQLGPPPTMYSPSADFKARVATMTLDDCKAAPATCPPPGMMTSTIPLPGTIQYTSDVPFAPPAPQSAFPPPGILPPAYSGGPVAPFYLAATPPPIAACVCTHDYCDCPCQAAPSYAAPPPPPMAWQSVPMTQPDPSCNYPPLPPTCVAAAPTAVYPAPQPPLTSQTVYPAAMPPFPPAQAYLPSAIAYQPGMPSYAPPAAPGSPTIGEASRLDHILEAVHHLEAAGMQAEADCLRRDCDERLRSAIANLRIAEGQWARKREISINQQEQNAQHAACDPSTQKMVKLQVQLMELNVAKMRNFGFDFATLSGRLSSGLARDPSGAGTKTAMTKFLDALQREEALTVLSRPTIMARSGERAVLQVGAQVPAAAQNADGTIGIAYETTGTVLEVVPTVVEDNKVHLQFHLHVSQPADASAGKLESDVQTVVVVPSGETSIISGCRSKQTPDAGEKAEVGVPADSNYFGSRVFVRDKTRENQAAPQETELLVVLQPEIVDPLAAQKAQASAPKPMAQARVAEEKHDSKRVAVHVQMLELNRTKMNNLGFDFASVGLGGSGLRAVGMEENATCGVAQKSAFPKFLKALKEEGIVKVAADPSVMTVSGRAATVFVGSEIPQISAGPTPTVEYARIGTEIDVVPIITGEDKVRLEIRGQHRVIDRQQPVQAVEAGTIQPVIKTHAFDTATELGSGQILILGGSTEKRLYSTSEEIPFVSGIADAVEQLVLAMTGKDDLADTVASFVPGRRVQTLHEEEIEHLMLVQPEIVAAEESVSKEQAQAAGQHPLTIDQWMAQPRETTPQWQPVRPTAAESPAADEGDRDRLAPKFTVPPPESNSSDTSWLLRSQYIPPATLHWSGAGELLPNAAAVHFEQLPPMGRLFDAPGEFYGIKPTGFDSSGQDQPSFSFSIGISR
jgi:type II secretory pathway component GspD/PulD (secretin)